MLETRTPFTLGDAKTVEKLIDHDQLMVNHMIFPKDSGLPEHRSNSNVTMLVIRGTLSLGLEDQETHLYDAGSIVDIPYDVRMRVGNQHDGTLEIFVLKAPSPRVYGR